MTEKEKASKGLLYDANYDPAILADRARAQDICIEYNQTRTAFPEKRLALLKGLLAACDDDIIIEPPLSIDYGYNTRVGKSFYANYGLTILDGAPVTFGDHVFVSPHCGFYTAGHPLDVAQRNAGLEYAKPIRVGNNVWIGAHVCVLPGVTIGDNAVIAAGSIVTRDVPAGVLAAGNPCRVVREIEEKPRRVIL
ncbi:sugar O-acetyltransferase [Agathobaculum sp.]|uniref:sugar O-acetyltransferase n=1 Tax=Agathobaculum sp. TaxID=2048138 RepID=UPI002A82D1F7|nr:sugar O-acetyltransferase [Agathobaculum sp.]MDY3619015.1 sugar O-acetyltransferase [Agathobaculum sp.]